MWFVALCRLLEWSSSVSKRGCSCSCVCSCVVVCMLAYDPKGGMELLSTSLFGTKCEDMHRHKGSCIILHTQQITHL